jgi:hypothetical protein
VKAVMEYSQIALAAERQPWGGARPAEPDKDQLLGYFLQDRRRLWRRYLNRSEFFRLYIFLQSTGVAAGNISPHPRCSTAAAEGSDA